jgi:hypothetical protein
MKNPFWAKASLCASLLVLSVGNCWAGLAGYGVIIGKPVGHSLYTGGQWPHYHISVQPAGGPLYDSALDLFSPSQAVATEVAHREIVLHPRNAYLYGSIFSNADGYYSLPFDSAGAATGGALDFARHPGILRDLEDQSGWDQSPLINAAKNDVPTYSQLLDNNGPITRVYIFGAPYTSGNGVHDVHANQGNFPGMAFANDNGIWQDGAVIIEYAKTDYELGDCNGQFCFIYSAPHRVLLMARFQAQSEYTDEAGNGVNGLLGLPIKGSAIGGTNLVSYGPFHHHQVELRLTEAGGDNPEVYIKSGAAPTASDYGVRAIDWARGYSPTAQLYISVKPSSNNLPPNFTHPFVWSYAPTFAD